MNVAAGAEAHRLVPEPRDIILRALALAGPLLLEASDAADSASPEDGLQALRQVRDGLSSLLNSH
jgi:hypothetical protein